MNFLRQSTVITVQMGPFLDAADGVTAEPSLSPSVDVSKAGAAFAARNSATAITHDADGFYRVELDATDTATLGLLKIKAFPAGAVPVWETFTVIPAVIYDALVSGTAVLPVNLTYIDGAATNGYNATLKLAMLDINNPAGDAIRAQSSGGNGNGLSLAGDGSGAGLRGLGGATGHGMSLFGGATSGNGLTATALAGNSNGLDVNGVGTGSGFDATGGQDGAGIKANGGTVSGDGVAASTNTGKQVSDGVVDAILDRAISEPAGVFAWGTASLRGIIAWLGVLSRNKITQTSTTQTVRNDADSATIATSTHSDDGTTATRGEFS